MKWSLFFALLVISWPLGALERHSDPDGCFSCHGLPGLEYIDEEGTRRTASILRKDYYASLHGSVPCRDCHRKIQDYPHDPKDGYVDCGQSCHVKEPSKGKAFSHRNVVEEFEQSAHGKGLHAGWTKDLHGGNRLKEVEEQQNPSCRRCHFNEPYIKPERLSSLKRLIMSTCSVATAIKERSGVISTRATSCGVWSASIIPRMKKTRCVSTVMATPKP